MTTENFLNKELGFGGHPEYVLFRQSSLQEKSEFQRNAEDGGFRKKADPRHRLWHQDNRRPGKNFFDALQKSGYEVRTKDLQIFPGGAKKGDWDVGITVDAIKLAGHLDVVVLVTGDGDYIPLVQYLQNTKGCRVEVIAFQESASGKLIEAADDFQNLSENKRKFLI